MTDSIDTKFYLGHCDCICPNCPLTGCLLCYCSFYQNDKMMSCTKEANGETVHILAEN